MLNQSLHHKNVTFKDEFKENLSNSKIEFDNKYLFELL